jgi:hypothetical protein
VPTMDTPQVIRNDEVVVSCVHVKGHIHCGKKNQWLSKDMLLIGGLCCASLNFNFEIKHLLNMY